MAGQKSDSGKPETGKRDRCAYIIPADIIRAWEPSELHPLDRFLGRRRCRHCRRLSYPILYQRRLENDPPKYDVRHCLTCFREHLVEAGNAAAAAAPGVPHNKLKVESQKAMWKGEGRRTAG